MPCSAPVTEITHRLVASPAGRIHLVEQGYGPLVLLRCLLLQQWYRLSDPGLEEALSDRLSFRR